MDVLRIRGARTHNLRNLDLDLPRNRLVVITGPSGSGKSSLAFDTLYAEGQRRYVESLSSYARQFLALLAKPEVDHIDGLSPAIAIEQKSTSHNPRSTVGTVTEIYDYLRLLYARVGSVHCPTHGTTLEALTVSQMIDTLLAHAAEQRVMLLAPVALSPQFPLSDYIHQLNAQGFLRVRLDGQVYELEQLTTLSAPKQLEVVIDRLRVRREQAQRLADSLETALRLGQGQVRVADIDQPTAPEWQFSALFACPECGYRVPELEPRLFSFNSPAGACPECGGLGIEPFFDPQRVVANPQLSLAQGAVRGWDQRSAYYFQLLRAVAKHYQFSLDTPFAELSAEAQRVVLYGSGETVLEVEYLTPRGEINARRHAFEGIIPNLERRYRETESESVREELANYRSTRVCPSCHGSRLTLAARHVRVAQLSLPALVNQPLAQVAQWFEQLQLQGRRALIAEPIVRELRARLGFLREVGLDYLTLARSADTLSGGEAQRIRLASQIGAGLSGVLYVLDEPSIGLHQRDHQRLLASLCRLRDLGNSVLVVEHDEDAMRLADYLVDMGPAAGVHGGQIVACGTPQQVMDNPASLTGQYLSGQRRVALPTQRHAARPGYSLRIQGARGNNLRQLEVDIPLGLLVCVTGVSGSGKSTLVNDTLYCYAARQLHNAQLDPAPVQAIHGLEQVDKVIGIDQSPIGRTPRSNAATYTGMFTHLRELFAAVPEARARGYGPGRFSFNVKGGRCEACAGDGVLRVEMHFLADVYVPCDVCQGQRYNRETLEIHYKGLNINQVLALPVDAAWPLFEAIPTIARKLATLQAVGLGYLQLGQAATTLSGGEAQRVKLARELARRDTGRTLYILDEPTTGLHFSDVEQLLQVLLKLRERGNTLVIIEHNLDVIKSADWIIDLGPEGGSGGGQVVVCGTPEQVAQCAVSHTGAVLRK